MTSFCVLYRDQVRALFRPCHQMNAKYLLRISMYVQRIRKSFSVRKNKKCSAKSCQGTNWHTLGAFRAWTPLLRRLWTLRFCHNMQGMSQVIMGPQRGRGRGLVQRVSRAFIITELGSCLLNALLFMRTSHFPHSPGCALPLVFVDIIREAADFVTLLRSLQQVFALAPDTVHMYYDTPPGRTVAFNRGICNSLGEFPDFARCPAIMALINR